MLKKLTALVLALLAAMGFPHAANALPDDLDAARYLDRQLSALVAQQRVKGAIAAVVCDTRILLNSGYGWADEQNGLRADAGNTAFQIGSVSKTWVAVAALQLVQSGKLDLHAPVTDYLEADFPKFKYEFTMHDLLTHTAGFEELFSGLAVSNLSATGPLAVSIRRYVPAQVFKPGDMVAYSNYGIALAGYVVERVAGQPFHEYAADSIFKPLGMQQTSFKPGYQAVPLAKAYAADGREAAEPVVNLYSAGSAVTTAADLARYMFWLTDGTDSLLNAAHKQLLFEQQYTMSAEFQGIGYTWNRRQHNGLRYYEKKGETTNFSSRIAVYPALKTAVFFAVNTDIEPQQLEAIMNGITARLSAAAGAAGPGDPGGPPAAKEFAAAQALDISGLYVSTCSNFTTIEKVLNLFIPHRQIKVTGNIKSGFKLNGHNLVPLGEQYYNSPLGDIKFIARNGQFYLVDNTTIAYVRTAWYEARVWQAATGSIFIAASLGAAVYGFSRLYRFKATHDGTTHGGAPSGQIAHVRPVRRASARGRAIDARYVQYRLLMCSGLVNIAAAIILGGVILAGISRHDLLIMSPYARLCAAVIVITAANSLYAAARSGRRKELGTGGLWLAGLGLSGLLFALWLVQVNILAVGC